MIESVLVVTPLGVVLHDLVTDARVVDGLRVDARPVPGGRVTPAFRTRSGAYAFRGLDGMHDVEMPGPGQPNSGPDGREFDVLVVDTRDRFVDTVLRVGVPADGLVSQAMLGLAGGSLPDDLPIYLFSSPARTLPGHLAVVRAELADDVTGEPAAHARLEVVVDAGGPGRRRYSGLSDATGAVVVPLPYPRFANAAMPNASILPPGTRGEPTADRLWPLEVLVHYEPDALVHPPGLPAPTLNSLLAQRGGTVREAAGGLAAKSLQATLRYDAELVLSTTGDPLSRLIVGPPAP
jgi:hypothetical protein